MIIVANGCSFIYGNELSDMRYTGASRLTYPALLSEGHEYHCVAAGGASNQAIARTTMDACRIYHPDFVFVQWTFPNRYEFRFGFPTGRKKSPWHDINVWATKDTDSLHEIEQEFHTQNDSILKEQINTIKKDIASGVSDFARSYYKYVAIEEYWEAYSTLKEIVLLQNYLKAHNIGYLFTAADNCILNNWTIEANTQKRRTTTPPGFQPWPIPDRDIKLDNTILTLYEEIDFEKFWWFPVPNPYANKNQRPEWWPPNYGSWDDESNTWVEEDGSAPIIDDDLQPRGFYQWAIENKYPVGTTHPLEEAHAAAAELLQETFDVHSKLV